MSSVTALIVGPAGVGKTTLIMRPHIPSAVGQVPRTRPTRRAVATRGCYEVRLESNHRGRIWLQDSGPWEGNPHYMSRISYRDVDVIIYMCKLTDRGSLEALAGYVARTRDVLSAEDWRRIKRVVIAGHDDQPHSCHQFDVHALKDFASKHQLIVLDRHPTISGHDFTRVLEVLADVFMTVYNVQYLPIAFQGLFHPGPSVLVPRLTLKNEEVAAPAASRGAVTAAGDCNQKPDHVQLVPTHYPMCKKLNTQEDSTPTPVDAEHKSATVLKPSPSCKVS